jgi:hypothetical protein
VSLLAYDAGNSLVTFRRGGFGVGIQLASLRNCNMFPRCLIFCTFLLASSAGGQAQPSAHIQRFGNNLRVEHTETVQSAACFLCSAWVDGKVTGSLHVFAGNAFLSGEVDGNVVLLGGSLSLARGAHVGGDVLIFGGHLQDGGVVLAHPPRVLSALVFLPLVAILSIVIWFLIVMARRMVREPAVYPPLPRL